jgi:uncharacterized protein YidB (DUF937 family)
MSLLGNVLGAALGGGNPVQGMLMNMLSAPQPSADPNAPPATGLTMLMEKFEAAGAGSVMQSWISTEANQMITPEHLQSILGATHLDDMATRFGMDSNTLASLLAQHLPTVVDQMTPHGTVPAPQ